MTLVMGRIRTEADKPYPYTDIKKITFAATKDRPGEISACITREAPANEEIDLGVPEKARGRLNWMNTKNTVWLVTKIGFGTIPTADGIVRYLGSGDNLGLAITSACETISGVAMMVYSYRNSIRRENYLYSIKESLGKQTSTGMLTSLGIAPTTPPKK